MQTDLREAVRRVCNAEEIKRAVVLMNYFSKACFIQDLHNERIQTIVRSRGVNPLISRHRTLARGGRLHTIRA
jgi:hypothetical protein